MTSCRSILIVEDDAAIRQNFVHALEIEGYTAHQSSNGKEALEWLHSVDRDDLPGCIILDLMMPEMNGLQFLEKIKGEYREHFGEIAVIIATAKRSPVDSEAIPDTVERIQKPLELDELYSAVKRHCGEPAARS